MKKTFKQIYKDILMPSLPFYGLGQLVSYAGFIWEITAFEPDANEECWVYDLKRVDGSGKTESDVNELGLTAPYQKARVEKPGTSVHTSKWDSCVKQVEASKSGANAYAVCTAMLGSDAFKSMDDDSFEDKVKFYMQKLGIATAGPVPNSLLARQDLEGEYTKSQVKKSDLNSFSVWYYDEFGARKCSVFGNVIDAEAFATLVDAMGFKNIEILKGQIEQTGKQLDQLADKALDGDEDKTDLVENIKSVQLRRQKATLAARSNETNKSFKQTWSNINKNRN